MLISFSVENFRSFKAEETLNLLASTRLGATRGSPHCREITGTGEHVLRVASLYGANGAGKSNLVRAIRLLEHLVLRGTPPGKPISYTPFVMDGESPNKPSSLELQFIEKGEVFRYGMSYDADRIHEEWLAVYKGKKEQNLFTRISKEDGTVTVTLAPTAKDTSFPQKIRALAEVGARPNQLFLTEVVNLDDPNAQGPHFQRVVNWFEIHSSSHRARFAVREACRDDRHGREVCRVRRSVSTRGQHRHCGSGRADSRNTEV